MGKKNNNLGRAIMKDRFKSGRNHRGSSHLHTTELEDGFDWNRLNLKSVTEQNTLDEFLSKAELAGTEFTAEKLNVSIVTNFSGVLSAEEERKTKETQDAHRAQLKIPRRPHWDESTTPEELDQRERESFLEWRRGLSQLQEVERIIMTPYERNLDFWRQLWRVIERSDVIVQIVDARNPLLFRCEDLETYVNEVDPQKVNMVLLNKSDFLSPLQRASWAKYFDGLGVRVAFWSAVEESERLKQEKLAGAADDDDDDEDIEDDEDSEENCSDAEECKDDSEAEDGDDDDEWEDVEEEVVTDEDEIEAAIKSDRSDVTDAAAAAAVQKSQSAGCSSTKPEVISNSPEILTGPQLIKLLRSLNRRHRSDDDDDVTTVGLVGYPNVGKSSTLNTLLQMKKVPVSATPGRTKHFQTLFLDPTFMLCDCPGLVMPSFVSTKADMVVNGILPIDQMKEYIPPVTIVCKSIRRAVLEATYGIMLPEPSEDEDASRPPTAYELLAAYATVRGYMTHKGIPDSPRAARYILKDYVNGKLLHCVAPPGVNQAEFEPKLPTTKPSRNRHETDETECGSTATGVSSSRPSSSCPKNAIDAAFFSQMLPRVRSHGTRGVIGFTRVIDYAGSQHSSEAPSSSAPATASAASATIAKPWKQHNNAKKREKLRRITSHLDA